MHFPHGEWRRDYPGYTLNRSLFKLIQYEHYIDEKEPEPRSVNVLVGDSLGNQLDPLEIGRIEGEDWFNLSYGQATLQENLALIDRLLERPETRTIAWVLPFTRIRTSPKNEIPRSQRMADAPLMHLFTFETLRGVYFELRYRWMGEGLRDPIVGDTVEERVRYSLFRMNADVGARPVPHRLLGEVDERLERARSLGIGICLIELPFHPDFIEGIQREMPEHYEAYADLLERHDAIRIPAIGEPGEGASLYRDAVHVKPEYKSLLNQEVGRALTVACQAN